LWNRHLACSPAEPGNQLIFPFFLLPSVRQSKKVCTMIQTQPKILTFEEFLEDKAENRCYDLHDISPTFPNRDLKVEQIFRGGSEG